MIIDPKGISKLSGIIFSCLLKKDSKIDSEKIEFIRNAKLRGGVEFAEFTEKIPLMEETRQELVRYTRDVLKKTAIDSEAVCSFFGGNPHIDYSIKNIAENGLGGIYGKIFLITHVLLPVKIRKSGGSISGVYSNQDLNVVFNNIQLAKDYLKIKDSQTVLMHYGFITSDSISPMNNALMLEIQYRRPEFVSACREVNNREVNNIDCEKLLKLFRLINKGSRFHNR